jgi:hypothetical protein
MSKRNAEKMIKGYLIDPFAETCTTVILPYTDFELFEKFRELMQCHLIDVVRLGGDTIMFVDDEGRCIDRDYQRWFKLGSDPYAGRSLIFSEDSQGNTKNVNRSHKEIEEHLEFLPEGFHEEPFMQFVKF